MFIKSSRKSQFPHKIVNLFFILVIVKDKLMDFSGNRVLQNGFINTFREINMDKCMQVPDTPDFSRKEGGEFTQPKRGAAVVWLWPCF